MSIRKRVSPGRPLAFGVVLLAVTALFLSWSYRTATSAVAQVPAPGLDLSMSIPDVAGCDTARTGAAECVLEPGQAFTVNFSLNSLPTGAPGYIGIDLYTTYTGVTSMDNPSMDPWPDCGFPAQIPLGASIRWGCAKGVDSPDSTYTGLISTMDFNCTSSESFYNKINLVHGETDTALETRSGAGEVQSAEGAGTMDTLTVHCGQLPTPTPRPTATPRPAATALPGLGNGTGLGQDNGASTTLWLIIGTLAAAAGTIGLFGWRNARSR